MNISQEAARKLFEEESPYVYRLALMWTRSPHLADDVTQETFLQAFRKYDTYDASRPVRPWLSGIAVNVMRRALRKQIWSMLLGDRKLERGSGYGSDRDVVLNEEKSLLRIQVNGLPRKAKEVVLLHFYGGLTLQEAADALGIPVGTCKSRLHYALEKLRNTVKEEKEFSMARVREASE